MTRDVDLVVSASPVEGEQLIAALVDVPGLYVPAGEGRTAVRDGGSFNVLHPSTGGKVDVFVRGADDAFTRSRLARRVRADVFGISCWVATAEDIVLAKLRWRLTSRSEQQWRDCVEIAAAQPLDREYLRRWAQELGVAEDLADLLGAGLS